MTPSDSIYSAAMPRWPRPTSVRALIASGLSLCAVALLIAGCGSTTETHPPARASRPTGNRARPAPHGPTKHHRPSLAPHHRHAGQVLGACPDPSRALDGVYHPDRLSVRDPCKRITGTVILVRPAEEDGDLHFDVRLDPSHRSLLMPNNFREQDGGLVVEFMPRDHGHLPAPSPGDRVSLLGAYVDDTEHAWAELHPVWEVSINGGPVARSGPQFGGSPPSAYSDSALATCRTNTGTRCTGYAGATAPTPSSPARSTGGGGGGGSCTPGYSPCIPPGRDADCAGGGGDGPRYVQGPVKVTGSDPYQLDSDGNGVGCE